MLCYVSAVLKIQRAFQFLYCPARHTVGIDHRCPYVAVAQKRLDRSDVVVGLQKVGYKTVTEGIGCDSLCEPDRA